MSIYSEDLNALAEAVNRLLDKPQKRKRAKSGVGQIQRPDLGASTGAHIHLERAATQNIDVGGEAVVWDTESPLHLRKNFAAVSDSASIVIQEPGYYNVAVQLGWDSFTGGGSVWITRTRGGTETTVWPLDGDPGLWTTTNGQFFEDVAHAIECLAGDILKVYVDADDASAQDLASATVSVYLVDRIKPEQGSRQAYRELILSQGPIFYLRLGEAFDGTASSGTAVDETGNGHDGVSSRIATTDGLLTGDPNKAALFSVEADETIELSDHADFDVSEMSVKVWVESSSTTNTRTMMSRFSQSGGETLWDMMCLSGSGLPSLRVFSPSSVTVTGTTNVCDGERHHVVGTFDGTNLRIYVDGVLEGTQAASPTLSGTIPIFVGSVQNNFGFDTEQWNGTIDEAAMWDRALSASEVAAQNAVGRSG